MASIEWILRFLSSRIHHLDTFHSDHKLILLCADLEYSRFYKKGWPFRFEDMWLKDSSCEEVICKAWGEVQQPVSAWAFEKKKKKLLARITSKYGIGRNLAMSDIP